MTKKVKKILLPVICLFATTLISNNVEAQFFKKLVEGGKKILDGGKKILDDANNLVPKPNSEIRKKDFFQLSLIPKYDSNNTRIKIAKNLLIDIKGKYPKGYQPKWRSITYNINPIEFNVENWVVPNSSVQTDPRHMSIGGDKLGTAGLRFSAFIGCDCFADIIIKDSVAVITDKPQTFKVTNFRKILNERVMSDPCKGIDNMYTGGGFEGKITLSANENGDIKMDLVIENYTVGYQPSFQKEYIPSQVSYKYFVKDLILENEMSAEKATEIVREEQEAKQRQKDYVLRTTKQADSIQKIILKKYTQPSAADCFYSSSGSYISTSTVHEYYVESGNYAGSRTDWDVNIKTEIKNKCSQKLLFIGIEQFYDDEKGYCLREVTKLMPANYSYSSDQGAMTSVFMSLIGGGSEFNIRLQDKYYPRYASVGSVQWLKVIKKL